MLEEAAAESGDDPDLDPDHSPDLSQQFTFDSWTGPKFIFRKVHKWAVKDWKKSPRGSIGWFLQYCWAFCECEEEEDEMFVWMLSLLSLYIKEDGWDGFCQGALKWDWDQVALRPGWAPAWAKNREEEDIKNGFVVKIGEEDHIRIEVKNDVKEDYAKEDDVEEDDVKENDVEEDVKEGSAKEDSVKKDDAKQDATKEDSVKEDGVKEDDIKEDDVKEDEVKENEVKEDSVKEVLKEETTKEAASPNSSWGSQLPPASPKTSKLHPTWRPWETQKLLWREKKRSPASEARSQRRLHEWQQRRDPQRNSDLLTKDCFSTPLPPSRELRIVRLTERLEGSQEPGSQALTPNQWSGSPALPSWLGSSSSVPTSSASPPWSCSQTNSTPPPQSGSQTYPTPPPWSGHQGNVHQDYWLSASNLHNHNMLQQSSPCLVTLPSPIPGFLPPPLTYQPGSVNGSTWGLLPALVTAFHLATLGDC